MEYYLIRIKSNPLDYEYISRAVFIKKKTADDFSFDCYRANLKTDILPVVMIEGKRYIGLYGIFVYRQYQHKGVLVSFDGKTSGLLEVPKVKKITDSFTVEVGKLNKSVENLFERLGVKEYEYEEK
jgi:hypothetical protein